MSEVPAGFEPLTRVSPIAELLGPFYAKGSGVELSLGLRVQPKHTNLRGTVHGGVLATIADMALGYTLAFASHPPDRSPSAASAGAQERPPDRSPSAASAGAQERPPVSLVTASLSIDYAGAAKIGDWLETRTDVQRQGNRTSFANCYIFVGDKRIVRASGVFLASDWSPSSQRV